MSLVYDIFKAFCCVGHRSEPVKTRTLLLFCMPIIFMLCVHGVYLQTGVTALLFINVLVVCIIIISLSILICLRKGTASCFSISDGTAQIGRQWPFSEIVHSVDGLSVRHLGDKHYQIKVEDLTLVFDRSRCTCMMDDEFEVMIKDCQLS